MLNKYVDGTQGSTPPEGPGSEGAVETIMVGAAANATDFERDRVLARRLRRQRRAARHGYTASRGWTAGLW